MATHGLRGIAADVARELGTSGWFATVAVSAVLAGVHAAILGGDRVDPRGIGSIRTVQVKRHQTTLPGGRTATVPAYP